MKKVLVIGAAGNVGLDLIKYLLAEGKYEITALDLKNKNVFKRLRRYRKRINIIYGDVLDRTLIENLVRDHDVVIYLSTLLPPTAEYRQKLSNLIEYNGIENIVRAINYYNDKCHLIYGSSTSIYNTNEIVDVKNKIINNSDNYFNSSKNKSERLIIKDLKKYTIIRVPLVLNDLRYGNFIYNIKKNSMLEVITKEDAAYAFCKSIDKLSDLNKKIINIGGGESCRCSYNDLLINILKYHGISCKYILTSLFVLKNYSSPYLKDSDESNKLLNYRNDSLQSYWMKLKRRSGKRKIQKLFAKPLIWFLNKNKINS